MSLVRLDPRMAAELDTVLQRFAALHPYERAWEVDGALPLHELEELAGEALAEDDVTTTSGFVMRRLGGFPKPGDVVELTAFTLRVETLDGMRVARLRLEQKAE